MTPSSIARRFGGGVGVGAHTGNPRAKKGGVRSVSVTAALRQTRSFPGMEWTGRVSLLTHVACQKLYRTACGQINHNVRPR